MFLSSLSQRIVIAGSYVRTRTRRRGLLGRSQWDPPDPLRDKVSQANPLVSLLKYCTPPAYRRDCYARHAGVARPCDNILSVGLRGTDARFLLSLWYPCAVLAQYKNVIAIQNVWRSGVYRRSAKKSTRSDWNGFGFGKQSRIGIKGQTAVSSHHHARGQLN